MEMNNKFLSPTPQLVQGNQMIYGVSGTGKTEYINNILKDIIDNEEFNERIAIFDSKNYEYNQYKDSKFLFNPIMSSNDDFKVFLQYIFNIQFDKPTYVIIDDFLGCTFENILMVRQLMKRSYKNNLFFIIVAQSNRKYTVDMYSSTSIGINLNLVRKSIMYNSCY